MKSPQFESLVAGAIWRPDPEPERFLQLAYISGPCARLSTRFPSIIFIGSAAIAEHMIAAGLSPRRIQDRDFVITELEFATLRGLHELILARSGRKWSFSEDYVDYDVYIDTRANVALPVSYAEIAATAQMLGTGVRVAGLDTLLIMKAAALATPRRAGKHKTDAQDVAEILTMIDKSKTADRNRDVLKLEELPLETLLRLAQSEIPPEHRYSINDIPADSAAGESNESINNK